MRDPLAYAELMERERDQMSPEDIKLLAGEVEEIKLKAIREYGHVRM